MISRFHLHVLHPPSPPPPPPPPPHLVDVKHQCGRFSEAWNALCNLSRKKSPEAAASLPSRLLSKRCFTLCIIIITDNFCVALFCGVPKLTALYNILQHFLSPDSQKTPPWQRHDELHSDAKGTRILRL